MSDSESTTPGHDATGATGATGEINSISYRLEVFVLPVSDVDRSKQFYTQAGFRLDVDHQIGDEFRVVQFTPPGSACSITFGVGFGFGGTPGSYGGIHLIVDDIVAARDALIGRGLEVGEVFHFTASGQTPGVDPTRRDFGTFATFHDPDHNGWLLQEVPSRHGQPTPT